MKKKSLNDDNDVIAQTRLAKTHCQRCKWIRATWEQKPWSCTWAKLCKVQVYEEGGRHLCQMSSTPSQDTTDCTSHKTWLKTRIPGADIYAGKPASGALTLCLAAAAHRSCAVGGWRRFLARTSSRRRNTIHVEHHLEAGYAPDKVKRLKRGAFQNCKFHYKHGEDMASGALLQRHEMVQSQVDERAPQSGKHTRTHLVMMRHVDDVTIGEALSSFDEYVQVLNSVRDKIQIPEFCRWP